jgi:hypothetical protein
MEVEETLDKDLCVVTPKWNKMIHESDKIEDLMEVKNIDGNNADLGVSSCCFIGEAWNWTNDYMGVIGEGCSECRRYSSIFLDAAAPLTICKYIIGEGRATKSFLAHARDFIAHFKRDHQDRYINKVNENKSLCNKS